MGRVSRFALPLLLPLLAGCKLITGEDLMLVSSADTTQVPAAERAAYLEDAARLALRYAIEKGLLEERQVEIPVEPMQALYRALILIHNAKPLLPRDFAARNIHTFPRPDVRTVRVWVDPRKNWVQAWLRGERLAGNPAIDSVMEAYSLQLHGHYESPTGGHEITLRAARPLNAGALPGRFGGIDGVVSATTSLAGGDGNDIIATLEESAWRLDYRLGLGDCPAGCTENHYWAFRVYSDSRVRYLGYREGRRPR